jgi:hypothetical protein
MLGEEVGPGEPAKSAPMPSLTSAWSLAQRVAGISPIIESRHFPDSQASRAADPSLPFGCDLDT